jgi:putative ABC transport system substrate-binding protein
MSGKAGMNRRNTLFALLALGAATWRRTVFAQRSPAKVARIGFLSAETATSDAIRLEAVRAGLRDLGYVEGKTFVIESRWANGKYDRLPTLAEELVRLKVDLIVTFGTKAVVGTKRASTTVPIVMASSGDIVVLGVVGSLASPGGNITGSTNLGRELGAKRLELLREMMPRVSKVSYLVNPANPAFGPNLQAIWSAAKLLKLEIQPFEVHVATEFESAFSEMFKRRINALVLQDDTLFGANAKLIASLALKHRLPSVGNKTFAEAGGLIGYGPDVRALDRRAAYFVDRILKSARPADLPIEQPMTYEMIINRATARALGLSVPQHLTLRASQLIQ